MVGRGGGAPKKLDDDAFAPIRVFFSHLDRAPTCELAR
jgi:hypothetical protein